MRWKRFGGSRARSSGRPTLGELEITITPREEIDVDVARRYADLGVHRLALLPRDLDSPTFAEELIERVGETVIGRV